MSLWERVKNMFNPADSAPSAPPLDPEAQAQAEAERYTTLLEIERQQKDAEFQHSPYSPLPPEHRAEFDGLAYFPPNPALRLTLPLSQAEAASIIIKTNDGFEQPFERVGYVNFEIDGSPARLAVYQSEGQEGYFIPFKDQTSGPITYGGGRYLEPLALGGDKLLVDFNLAYNPYCAYSSDFSCPLPPAENWLKVPIEAGEKTPPKATPGQ